MASTTTNLGLTKPAYSDDADISDINGNMDLIDAEAGRVRANVAANYDSSETYAVGDYCLHDGSLYKCSTAISSPEAWTAGHWTQIKITGELSALNGNIATNIGDASYPIRKRFDTSVSSYTFNIPSLVGGNMAFIIITRYGVFYGRVASTATPVCSVASMYNSDVTRTVTSASYNSTDNTVTVEFSGAMYGGITVLF